MLHMANKATIVCPVSHSSFEMDEAKWKLADHVKMRNEKIYS